MILPEPFHQVLDVYSPLYHWVTLTDFYRVLIFEEVLVLRDVFAQRAGALVLLKSVRHESKGKEK